MFESPVLSFALESSTHRRYAKFRDKDYVNDEKEFNCIVIFSTWLRNLGFTYGIQIAAASIRGWKYTLQPLRVVPADSPIFELSRNGNIDGVRTLLSKGYASPYDRNTDGQTPLWVCYSRGSCSF